MIQLPLLPIPLQFYCILLSLYLKFSKYIFHNFNYSNLFVILDLEQKEMSEKKSWLRHNTEPRALVRSHMIDTWPSRCQWIHGPKQPALKEVFENYPRLSTSFIDLQKVLAVYFIIIIYLTSISFPCVNFSDASQTLWQQRGWSADS